MLKHVVMFVMKDTEDADRRRNAEKLESILAELPAQIPQIRHWEVGAHALAPSANACDLVLISGFDSEADLDAYRVHPAHQEVVDFINRATSDRRAVDFWTERDLPRDGMQA